MKPTRNNILVLLDAARVEATASYPYDVEQPLDSTRVAILAVNRLFLTAVRRVRESDEFSVASAARDNLVDQLGATLERVKGDACASIVVVTAMHILQTHLMIMEEAKEPT